MNRSPLISVVMPVLNAAHHLPRSLGSLTEQRWRKFEVVLVDGGSHDGTVTLASQILTAASLPHRIDVVPNSGIYDAMNHGVDAAKGDWIYVLGSDDKLLSSVVFEAIAPSLRAARPSVLVVHGDVWIEDPGYRYGQAWDLPRLLERNISHQSAFYRHNAIRSLGIKYNASYSLYADWDYNLRLFSRGRFHYVPLPVASYACTGKSSQQVDKRFIADMDGNALRYFGWRSCFLIPPHRFALGCGKQPTLWHVFQLGICRFSWIIRRTCQKTN